MPKRVTHLRVGYTVLRERPLLLEISTWDDGSSSYRVQDQETGFTLHPGSLDTMPGIEDIEAMIHTLETSRVQPDPALDADQVAAFVASLDQRVIVVPVSVRVDLSAYRRSAGFHQDVEAHVVGAVRAAATHQLSDLVWATVDCSATALPTVTLYSDGELVVTPPGSVSINSVLADGDEYCRCGCPIFEDAEGVWVHRDSPEVWGNDHDAIPEG